MGRKNSVTNLRLLYLKEALITTLVGWIPLKPGRVLRRVLYRNIFAGLGKSVQIEPGVEFVNADRTEIGEGVKIDRYVRLRNVGRDSKIRIGDWVRLNRAADLKLHSGGSGYIEIGDYTSIGPYTCMTGRDIKIGKYCLIAPHVGIFANNHVFTDPTVPIVQQGHTYKGIVIEDDCWLGSGVKVLDGVTIGRGSVIGAGAVVTKDIPPYSIAVGVPAKVVGKRDVSPNKTGNSEDNEFQNIDIESQRNYLEKLV
ncbi:acyltransferase [Planktothrix sp. FACHB-1355]|uniref:Acyltransferase n=1 Tax=Aerosakkonema funiforme FACHB-1375 TaxID=2949571 RepID=A0A926VJ51_9CYAN|nr:acyltransferase [Planktothrix sp. FACHB-1355]MBD2183657.1 acyltransferase [Aerosakkonema funiforme FACHB-1375]MBD3559499.1 acyltransferase [Planktothrix sp. FACHB-1355]